MRVAMVDPANLTPFYSYALCDSLATNGCKVTFHSTQYDNDLTLESPDSFELSDHYFTHLRKLQRSGNKLIRKLVRGCFYYFDHRALINKIIANKTDVVHIQWAMLPFFDIKLVSALKQSGIPVILTVHDVDPLFDAGSKRLITKLYNLVSAIVVHNNTAAQDLARLYPCVPKDKVVIVPHGPLQSQDIPTGKTLHDARVELNIANEADVVCFFGEIKHYKGLDYLVEACLKLQKKKPSLFLLIAGKPGSEDDIPDLTALDKAGIPYRADFGFVANEDVWKYYLSADIIALPYRQISQSGVLFSALAHKRYVICSAVGALPEIISEVGGGATFKKGDVDGLSNILNEKLDNKNQLFIDAEIALDNVENLYGWKSISEKTKGLYGSLKNNH